MALKGLFHTTSYTLKLNGWQLVTPKIAEYMWTILFGGRPWHQVCRSKLHTRQSSQHDVWKTNDPLCFLCSFISWINLIGGGFKYFFFSPLLGEDSHFDSYFSYWVESTNHLAVQPGVWFPCDFTVSVVLLKRTTSADRIWRCHRIESGTERKSLAGGARCDAAHLSTKYAETHTSW